jgi:hypothetical protein
LFILWICLSSGFVYPLDFFIYAIYSGSSLLLLLKKHGEYWKKLVKDRNTSPETLPVNSPENKYPKSKKLFKTWS